MKKKMRVKKMRVNNLFLTFLLVMIKTSFKQIKIKNKIFLNSLMDMILILKICLIILKKNYMRVITITMKDIPYKIYRLGRILKFMRRVRAMMKTAVKKTAKMKTVRKRTAHKNATTKITAAKIASLLNIFKINLKNSLNSIIF
jgi:hypothetical protein